MKQHPQWFRLLFISLLILLLGACNLTGDVTPSSDGAPVQSEESATAPVSADRAPNDLRLEIAPSPALDPACLTATDGFNLRSAVLPAAGLEPGSQQLFCAVGAPIGVDVLFSLVGPDGGTRSFSSLSVDGGAAGGVATLLLRLTTDDAPGTYTLTAALVEGDESSVSFEVMPATTPYIALSQPLETDPQFIYATVGGLPADGVARFSLYSLAAAAQMETGAAMDGSFLISTGLVADATGQADLQLDVADLPAGAYLLLLLPAGVELGDPAVLRLPEQDRLALMVNIDRGSIAAETPAETVVAPTGDMPAAPSPVAAGGGVPETAQFLLPAAALPACQADVTLTAPRLQLWPDAGEIGDWWYGCASGFAPSETVVFTVDLANGQQSQFSVATSADGTAPFRWYAMPGEGFGAYTITAEGAGSSLSQTAQWEISAASRPHVLVYPHTYQSGIGGELYLSGFPASAAVDLGLYKLDGAGMGTRVKQWQVRVNKYGAFVADFTEAFGLEPGQYALIAQGGPAFAFAGVDVAVSDVEFFSFDADLDPRYEFYTLYAGRSAETTAVAPTPVAEATTVAPPVAEATVVAPPTTTEVAQVPPAVFTISEDVSARPTCPGAPENQPAICLLPTTFARGSFTYLLMHNFPPDTAFTITVTPPRSTAVPLTARADAEGFAEAHWYALNTEPLGDYQVSVRGGGQSFDGVFTITAATSPHMVVQTRVTAAGVPVIASVAGFQPEEDVLLARYRRTGAEAGAVSFALVDTFAIKTGGAGGGQQMLGTASAQQGDLFLIVAFRPGQPEALAQAVYSIGEPLNLRYPFGWGQNDLEGQ